MADKKLFFEPREINFHEKVSDGIVNLTSEQYQEIFGEAQEETLRRMSKIYSGQYRDIFEEIKKLNANVIDYHNLYAHCLQKITYILAQNIDCATKGIFEHTSYNKEIFRWKELKKKLDETFNEFTSKIEIPQEIVSKFIQTLEKKDKPEYIIHLRNSGVIYPDDKTPTKSLKQVAIALKDWLNRDLYDSKGKRLKERCFDWKFLQKTFFKLDGSEYSERECKEAVNLANTSPIDT